jgi:hypothetical protein
MTGRSAIILILSVCLSSAAFANFCMDCIQRQIRHDDPDRVWFESDGVCCMLPCYGYSGYDAVNENVGYGCSTMLVNNALVVGDICNSSNVDDGCPETATQPVAKQYQDCSPFCGSPILLDLGAEAYRLTSLPDGVTFDLRNEGRPSQMAWTRTGVENAFLARDSNANGRIDDGAELFGNFTPLRSGELASNGFRALAELDDNDDGVLDASDATWPTLLLWTDRNHDGHSSPDELQPIAESAVAALETDHSWVGRRDQWGNEFRFMAHFRLREASSVARRTYYDIFFRTAP